MLNWSLKFVLNFMFEEFIQCKFIKNSKTDFFFLKFFGGYMCFCGVTDTPVFALGAKAMLDFSFARFQKLTSVS